MADIFRCRDCGAVTAEKEHLCVPEAVTAKSEYCGAKASTQVCETRRPELAFTCETCGRSAEQSELLCRPAKIAV
jgi:hypothetical protein